MIGTTRLAVCGQSGMQYTNTIMRFIGIGMHSGEKGVWVTLYTTLNSLKTWINMEECSHHEYTR